MPRSVTAPCLIAALLLLALTACRPETRTLPPGVTYTQALQGRALYQEYCAACHGRQGEGQDWRTPVPQGMLPPPAHNAEGHTWHHPDEQLLEIIAEGGKAQGSTMPAFKDRLTLAERKAILAYIKTMWGPAEQQRQAELSRLGISDHTE